VSLAAPGSALWLLGHEMRLYWRNFRGGRAGKGARGLISLIVVAAMLLGGGVLAALGLHDVQVPINPISISLAALATAVVFTLMLSQTLSASSEALYERNDLDLLFSSPIGPAKVLFVRSLGVAGGVVTIFALIVTPLLLPSIVWGHPGWIGVLGVLGALALASTAAGVVLAMMLFALIGPRRTRTVAQVLAALVGAAFFLVSQTRTILGEQKSNSLFAEITRQAQEGRLHPAPIMSLPLRAMLGEPLPLLALLAGSALLFWLAASALGRRFSDAAAATQGKTAARPAKVRQGEARRAFAAGPFLATLRKELLLISRDAALLSQVLLRVLYLIPTALVLSRNAAHGAGPALAGGAGVVAFLAGQVAGSLAWITLSAEEAPDLLAVSPARIRTLRRAKIAAALIPVALFLVAADCCPDLVPAGRRGLDRPGRGPGGLEQRPYQHLAPAPRQAVGLQASRRGVMDGHDRRDAGLGPVGRGHRRRRGRLLALGPDPAGPGGRGAAEPASQRRPDRPQPSNTVKLRLGFYPIARH
jgi:ABC-2 type transport system permease protein